MSEQTWPQRVKHDSRICYGVDYYATEAEAELADKLVRQRGDTYNGGWFDGMPCGRDPHKDYDDPEHGRLYAVTVR